MGARPLRRAIQRYIEDPLADFVLGRQLAPGSTILVDRKGDTEEVDITVIPGRPPEPEEVTVPPDGPADEAEEARTEPAAAKREQAPGNIDGDPGNPEPPSAAREWAAAPHDSRKLTWTGRVAPTPGGGESEPKGESLKGGGINRGARGRLLPDRRTGRRCGGRPYEARKRAM